MNPFTKACRAKFARLVLAGTTVLSLAAASVSRGARQEEVETRFATSSTCAMCHDAAAGARALRDDAGQSVAPYDLWRSTAMASSARDPLWRAVVSAEVAATPSLAAAIEAKCARCHAPMAPAAGLASLTAGAGGHDLAIDGVSCTVCHRISDAGLGDTSTFSGRFPLASQPELYGPHAEPFAMPMLHHSGFRPVESQHVLRSALCGTCHTLFTDTVTAAGMATGARFPEQTPYLEWRNSIYNDEREQPTDAARSCASCHVPTTDDDGRKIRTRIAHNPGGRDFPRLLPRAPVGRHVFVGGNTLLPALLSENATELEANAPPEAYGRTAALARRQLETGTARISLADARRDRDSLKVSVLIENLAGHKLPTGFPARRAWLRLRIKDADGRLVFASGEHDTRGRIIGPSGEPLPVEQRGEEIEPHHALITRPGQTQIYEVVLADTEGLPTWTLLRAARYWKDNRLLPRGWSASHRDAAATRPVGTEADADFLDGRDTTRFEITAQGPGPHEVEVDLLYEPLGARFAAELFVHETPEVSRFRSMLERAPRVPERVASARTGIP
jgi:hypothetical protein